MRVILPQALQKPLVWDRIKDQARFHRFRPKVVHLVLDDVRSMVHNEDEIFALEGTQVKRTHADMDVHFHEMAQHHLLL